jgi:hypothetical protein
MNYTWKIACTGMIFLGVLCYSCKNNNFDIGDHLFPPLTVTGMIDTVTIKVSNLAVSDSVITSNKGIGFTGSFYDTHTGTIQTRSYIEFNRTTDGESDKNARFDSVMLVLRPNGGYYGDTVKRAAFKVSRLEKPIERRDDNNLYSTSILPVGGQLADTAIRIKVKDIPNNEFEVRLPNSFGRWLFQGILRDDDNFKLDKFQKSFPGLTVGAGTGSDCVYGLNLQDTACMIRIYYHVSSTYKENKTMTFKSNPYNCFYNLTNDRENLPHFNSKSDPVPSTKAGMDNRGVIMSGTPMYTRLEFPHLKELLWLGQTVEIKKATLYVRPIHRSFDVVPLPPKLNIYYFDPTSNTPLSSAIKPPSSNQNTGAQDGNLPKNYHLMQSPEFPQYTFDVTDFISSQLGKSGYDKWALSLLIPVDEHETTLQRLVFGDQNYWYKNENQSRDNRIKLELIYEVYND